jgi:hypothetical protein
LTTKKKFTLRGQTYEIKDSSKNKIGLIKRNGQIKFSKEIWIEDNDGNEIFRSEVPNGFNIIEEIYDDHGEVIGKITGSGGYNSRFIWTLEVFKPSINRLYLWSMFLSILSTFNPSDFLGSGGAHG